MELVTVRIPELPSQSALTLEDKLPIWVAADNKTRHTSISLLRDLIITGGEGEALPVVVNGGTIIHIVTADEAGGDTVSIPSLAGKTFRLRRSGQPLLPKTMPVDPTAEYECLSSGGFKLLQSGDVLFENERFELDVFSLQGGSSSGSTGGSAALITGQILVTTNLTLNPADHLNKLISIRAGNSIITVTLPSVEDVPDNTIIPIETTILNNWQARITTQGGQYIYMRNLNYSSVYMGVSDSLWLYRADDGWYVINDFAQRYFEVGKIQMSYKVGIGEVLANGQTLLRSAYPRLWEYVQGLGSSLVTDTVWNTAAVYQQGGNFFTTPPGGSYVTINNPYRGCFSTGDGSTNFRVPNMMNMAVRGVASIIGSDSQRYHNFPGGYQRHELESHNHVSSPFNKAGARASDVDNNATPAGLDSGLPSSEYAVGNMSIDRWNAATIQSVGGSETRMDNIGVLWTIKA